MESHISQYNFFIFKVKEKCINFPEVLVAFSVSQKVFCCCCFFVGFFFPRTSMKYGILGHYLLLSDEKGSV